MPTSERPVALMTPTVTVWSRPKGLPMAMAHSPTRSASELPRLATVSSWSGWKLDHREVRLRVGAEDLSAVFSLVGEADQ